MKTKIEKISMKKFLTIKENPRQRNTEYRAKKARKAHLATWHPLLELASASRTPDGTLYLNDGHTRRYLIKEGHFDKKQLPEGMYLQIMDVKTLDEVCTNYNKYDSKAAVEQATDANFSTMKGLGYVFASERFQQPSDLGAIASNCCDGSIDTREDWMRLWFDEIVAIDKYNIPKGKAKGCGKTLTAGTIAACVMLISRGYDVKQFMLAVRNCHGNKRGAVKDGVQHLTDWIVNTEDKTSGYLGYENVIQRTLACFDMYHRGHMQAKPPMFTNRIKDKYHRLKSLVDESKVEQ